MLKPSVCIDAVFEDLSVPKAIAKVAETDITAFEFWGWWDKDLPKLTAARDKHGLTIAACCTPFISLVDPATRDDYLEGLENTTAIADELGIDTIISQVGDFRLGIRRKEQHDCLIEGLKGAAPILEDTGQTLVIEPLNELIDHDGYYLVQSEEAFHIIDEVDSPNIKVIFDIYHQQISEGQLITNITENIDKIAHFHAAGNPGRNELTRGELNYRAIFDAIQATDFDGYVGLEYWPIDDPLTGLREVAGWFA